MNLLDCYGWEVERSVSIEEGKKEVLEMDQEKSKSLLEQMSNGIEFDNFEGSEESEENGGKGLRKRRCSMRFGIYGSDSSGVG